jgi:methionine--tRNA ligase beta chain
LRSSKIHYPHSDFPARLHLVRINHVSLSWTFCYLSGVKHGASGEAQMISIDEFRNMELRVATIKSAEPHPNADKLMVLQIDLGAEQRQICAGIKNHYTTEELVGKQIVVVANLETAKLRGLESQGMLLAASDEGRVIILTPEKTVQPGAKVS